MVISGEVLMNTNYLTPENVEERITYELESLKQDLLAQARDAFEQEQRG